MATKENMIDQVRNFLDNDNWNYEYDEGRSLITFGISLKCKLQNIRVYLRFSDDCYSTISTISMKADEQYRASVAEYLTRANFGLKNGNFEMDFEDGEIRYKVFVSYKDDAIISDAMIYDSIILPAMMFDRYGDGLAALLFGFSTAKDEIEKIEKQ